MISHQLAAPRAPQNKAVDVTTGSNCQILRFQCWNHVRCGRVLRLVRFCARIVRHNRRAGVLGRHSGSQRSHWNEEFGFHGLGLLSIMGLESFVFLSAIPLAHRKD